MTWVAPCPSKSECTTDYLSCPITESEGADFLTNLTPNSLKTVSAFVEPSLATAQADAKFQFERDGYFVADRVDHRSEKPVFNLAVGLKDSWGK